MIRRLAEKSGTVFALAFVWKLVLFVFTMQPVPFNDSFFYDGAVVNLLNGGNYCNPQLALALPIAGTEVFAAYPPLYQVVLLGWMGLFGTGVAVAMTLHLLLFGLYLLALLGIFRQLEVPGRWVNLAGLFLLVNTFHDRPDSLAIWLGVCAIYAWIRGQNVNGKSVVWNWLASALIILALCANLQFGGIFIGTIWVLGIANTVLRGEKMRWGPLAATILLPVLLVALVKFGYPRLWEGFSEHARETPGVTGFRAPALSELLKVTRTLPGFCLALVFGLGLWLKNRERFRTWLGTLSAVVWMGATANVMAFTLAATTVLSGNSVLAGGYLQPLVVGLLLAGWSGQPGASRWKSWWLMFAGLALVCSVRAIGMSTWGVACAADVSHPRAIRILREALDSTPAGATVAVSAAYLYDAVHAKEVRVIHSDWLAPPTRGLTRADAVVAVRPAKMILTQFDRYRFYGEAIPELLTRTNVVEMKIIDTARTPVPDASPRLQRVVQHISWAPVIVEFTWK